MKQELIDELLNRAQQCLKITLDSGAATAEVFSQIGIIKQVLYSSKKIINCTTSEEAGFGIRYQKNNQMFFQTIDGYEEHTFEKKLKTSHGAPVLAFNDSPFNFAEEQTQFSNNFEKRFDPQISELSLEDLQNQAKSVMETVQSHKSPIFVESGSLSTTVRYTALVNSNDLQLSHSDSFITTQNRFIAGSKKEITFEKNMRKTYHNLGKDPLVEIMNSLDKLTVFTKPKRLKDNLILPIVFNSHAMNQIGDLILRPLFSREFSPFRSREKLKISRLIEIVDECNNPERLGSLPWDHEGIPTNKTLLYREGKPKQNLSDLRSTKKSGKAPSGTTLRGIPSLTSLPVHRSPPSPILTNISITPYDKPQKNLTEGIEKGVKVDSISSVNFLDVENGNFEISSFETSHIKRGEIKKSTGKITLFGNIYELLSNLMGVGNEIESGFYSAIPSMKFNRLRVLGKPK